MALLYQHHLAARCSVAVISKATTSPGVRYILKGDPLHVCCRRGKCKLPPLLREESFRERPSEVPRYHKHTDSSSSIESETPRTRQTTDTNYANVSQLADVSMETGTSKAFFFFFLLSYWFETPPGGKRAGGASTRSSTSGNDEDEE